VKALVTGGSGFVGRHLVSYLRAEGDDVVGADRDAADPVDIVDRDAVLAVVRRARPDVIYHLAAFTHVGESWAAPQQVLRVNVEGTMNVLQAAIEAGGARVLVLGSAEEYGRVTPAEVPIREDHPVRPVSPYGASKAAASLLALQAHLGQGLHTVRVRPFNHTGPGQPPRFLVPALAHRIAAAERAGDEELRVGSLDPVRDLNDVRDVVRAYRLLAEHGRAGEDYNVCTGHGVSVRDVAERLVAMAARPLQLVVDPELVRPVDIPVLVGDSAKLREATGWAPEISLEQTLADTLESARASI
jgi:GDP-4-dehydro-6-deoxy-D-mannose reductase